MRSDIVPSVPISTGLSTSSPEALEGVRRIETLVRSVEQLEIPTEHVLHAGMYARTIRVPAGTVFTSVLIKIATLVVIHGDAEVFTGDGWIAIGGYGVMAGGAFRKQVYVARSGVEMTMVFPTQAQTVDEAEREFTDEVDELMSRGD